MIIRLVKMSFKPEEVDNFLSFFETVKSKIRAREGCTHLALWQQKNQPNVLFTFSLWENESALESYRHSDLFKETWALTKIKFNGQPEAWSVEQLVSSDNNILG